MTDQHTTRLLHVESIGNSRWCLANTAAHCTKCLLSKLGEGVSIYFGVLFSSSNLIAATKHKKKHVVPCFSSSTKKSIIALLLWKVAGQSFLVGLKITVEEEGEDDTIDRCLVRRIFQPRFHRLQDYISRIIIWVPVDAGRNAGKCDGSQFCCLQGIECVLVARREELRFLANWTNTVNDVWRDSSGILVTLQINNKDNKLHFAGNR